MAKAKRHIHKYERVIMDGNKVWKCARPDCGHYMPRHQEVLVIGKYSECWGCGETIELNASNMTMDKPECYDCQMGIKINTTDKVVIPEDFDINDLLGKK